MIEDANSTRLTPVRYAASKRWQKPTMLDCKSCPGPFDRIPAEMHDPVDPGGDLLYLAVVGEIGGNKFLVAAKVGGVSEYR